MTLDVESFSLHSNREDPQIADAICECLPNIFELLSKYDIKSTFYFTGTIGEQSPELIELVKDNGHEIGCHGYDHSQSKLFHLMTCEEQIIELEKARNVLEPICGKITSFRAPSLCINNHTARALENTGFNCDSSVASQRFDGPLSFGAKEKLNWLYAPRKPYMLSHESYIKQGNSNILEVPISAFILPFIGTVMRISPYMTKLLKNYLFLESKITGKPLVFLFHPNECLNRGYEDNFQRRGNNFIDSLILDQLKYKLKLRNLGQNSLKLVEDILKDAKTYGFDFISVQEFREEYNS